MVLSKNVNKKGKPDKSGAAIFPWIAKPAKRRDCKYFIAKTTR